MKAEKHPDPPDWLDSEKWAQFVKMRKAKGRRAPFTPYAARNIIAALARFKDQGLDPNVSLDNSTRNGWSDVYEPKPDQAAGLRVAMEGGARQQPLRQSASQRRRERLDDMLKPKPPDPPDEEDVPY